MLREKIIFVQLKNICNYYVVFHLNDRFNNVEQVQCYVRYMFHVMLRLCELYMVDPTPHLRIICPTMKDIDLNFTYSFSIRIIALKYILQDVVFF